MVLIVGVGMVSRKGAKGLRRKGMLATNNANLHELIIDKAGKSVAWKKQKSYKDDTVWAKFIYSRISVSQNTKTKEIVIDYYRKSQKSGFDDEGYVDTFNPKYIKSIELSNRRTSDPVGVIVITLTGKTGKEYRSYNGSTESSNEMLFPFLQSDPENFSKIKKALEHLKRLVAEEEFDPFEK